MKDWAGNLATPELIRERSALKWQENTPEECDSLNDQWSARSADFLKS